MTEQQAQQKVLHIGVYLDGKVVQERFIEAGASVTVGTGTENTFTLDDVQLSADAYTLFEHQDGQYWFHFDGHIKGKLGSEGPPVALERIASELGEPDATGGHKVQLSEQDRGKIDIGPYMLLFRFSNPPPVQAAIPLEEMDFRPKMFDEDDPIMLVSLAFWSALGLLFGVWVTVSEPPEIELKDLEDRFQQLIVKAEPEPTEDEPEEDEEPEETENANAKKVAKKAEPKKADTKPREPQTREEKIDQAKAVQNAKDELASQSALFQALAIGSTGRDRGLSTGASSVMKATDGLSGKLSDAQAAIAKDGGALRTGGGKGTGVGDGPRGIDAVQGSADGVGVGTAGSAELRAPKASVNMGALDFGGGDAKGLARILKRYNGRLKYCYEQSLKRNPALSGRVVIAWQVDAGRATDVYVHQNGTGDGSFAQCLVDKIKQWQFDGVEDGPVKQPWVFQPQE